MEQVTTLRLAIDSRDAVKAQKDLDNLAKSSSATEKAASGLSRAIGIIGFAAMGTEAIKTADAMNRLDGRLRLATESTAEYTAQWKELADVAERSRSGLSETITLFTKLNPAVKQLGGDTAATNKVVEAFSKSLKVGGANSAESASAILQFAQAMGSGVLRGEEFNAVYEASQKTMSYLAEGMGVPIGQMRNMAAQGELTSGKVAAAMLKMTEQINKDFGTIPLTVGDALTQAKNELSIFILETDKAYGITQTLAGGITDSVAALKSAVGVYQEYSNIINGMAVSAGVLIAANKASVVTEEAIAAIRARNTVTTTAYDAALMRTVTTTTTLTTAQSLSAAASYAMGTALRTVPFLAVAGVVATLAYTFFDAKEKSDDLKDSLNATAESLGKLTKAQLEYKRANLSLELQSVGLELRQLQQEYGVTNKRTAEQQKEIDDLKFTYKALNTAAVQVAAAQTALREGKKASTDATKKENKSIEDQIKLFEKNAAATKKVTAAKKELSDVEKARHDALVDNADLEAEVALSIYKAQQDAIQDNADREAQAAIDIYNTALYWDKELASAKLANISAVTLAAQEAEDKAIEESLHKWDGFFDDLNKAMENQLFDAMVGKWDNFGDWLKDFWSSLVSSIARASASQLSTSIISGLRGGLSEGGIAQNLIKAISGGTVGVGTTLSASDLASVANASGTWSQAGSTNLITAGGSVISAGGQILQAGSDVSDLVSTASNLKSAYGLITSGLENTIAPYVENLGNFLQATNFNIGGTSVGLGAGLLGGVGGYAAGALGDKLFGADTKASALGSIGGALGAAFGGPVGFAIGAGLGSVIGGMFGSKKVTGEGLSFTGVSTGKEQDVVAYTDYRKKSWFSSKSWTTYAELTDSEKKNIDAIFDSYDYLLAQLGSTESIFLEAGKYSGQTFVDQLAKNFIGIISTAGNDAEIYDAWKEYADSVNSTMGEAFSSVISDMISGKRSFTEWALGKGTLDQLSFTASYLQDDFDLLAKSLDATGVNVANFQQMYDAAIAENFTPENISQWNSLGEALMSATDAATAYTSALAAQEEAYTKLLADAATAQTEAMSAIIATVTAIEDTFKSLRSTTKSLVDSLSTGKGGTADVQYYLKQYNEQKASFMSAFDPTTGIVYSDSIAKMESAYNDLSNTISSLSGAGITDAQKASLLREVTGFDTLFATNQQAMQVEVIGGSLSVLEMSDLLKLTSDQLDAMGITTIVGSVQVDKMASLLNLNTDQKGLLDLINQASEDSLVSTSAQLKSLLNLSTAQVNKLANLNVSSNISKETLSASLALSADQLTKLSGINSLSSMSVGTLANVLGLTKDQKQELIDMNLTAGVSKDTLSSILGLNSTQSDTLSTMNTRAGLSVTNLKELLGLTDEQSKTLGSLDTTALGQYLTIKDLDDTSTEQAGYLDLIQQLTEAQKDALYAISTKQATDATLTRLDTWLEALYKAQLTASAAETAPLSAASFSAGHTLGTQEKVDFARLTGETIGTTAFNDLLTNLQGFSTTSTDFLYLKELAGISGTTVSNPEIMQMMSKLAAANVLPADALNAFNVVNNRLAANAQTEYDRALVQYNDIIAKATLADQVVSMLGSAWKANSVKMNADQLTALKTATDKLGLTPGWQVYSTKGGISTVITGPEIWSILKNFTSADDNITAPTLKTKFYYNGGYTGDIGTHEVAGIVHGQEYVVNAKTTRDLGLNNQGGLFKAMVSELSIVRSELAEMKNYAVTQTATAVKNLNVNRAILGSMPQV